MRIGLIEFLLILAIASLPIGPQVALFVDRWMRRATRANARAARRRAEYAAQMAVERDALLKRFRTASTVFGVCILLALVYAVQFTVGIPMWNDVMNKSTIANIHTLSSVAAMLLFLPCSSVLSKLAMLTVPDNKEEEQELSMPVLDERLFKSPAVALQQAKNAVVKMSRRAARNVTLATPLLLKMDADTVSAINVRENLIDRMEVEISNYLIKMTDQELNDDESHEVT